MLGGPHARSYPDDSVKYFDYVLGFTHRSTVKQALNDCSSHQPIGVHLSAKTQPIDFPSMRERWKFIEPTLKKDSTVVGM